MIRVAAALACLLTACSSEPAQRAEGSGAPPLWIVEGPDGVEGWLFGTVHSLPDGTRWRTATFDETLQAADLLVVEVADLDDATLGEVFGRLAFDEPPSASLEARIEPAYHGRYEQLARNGGLPRQTLDRMESWAAALALNRASARGTVTAGVDRVLIDDAEAGEIVELEGAEAQLSVFDDLPEAEQRDLLNAVLRNSAGAEAELERLASIWSEGDLTALEATVGQGLLADPELYEALLATRNRDWAARLENLFSARARPFVAVGAAHMFGPDGLPTLLRKRGYAVRAIQ